MIVILCDSFQDAKDAFRYFLNILQQSEPFTITRVYYYGNSLETDEDLRYIFIDRMIRKVFEGKGVDYIEEDEFFYYFGLDYYDETGVFG